jgi:hypothetical protein
MMAAAKMASEKIRALSKKLRETAKNIPGKNMSERKEQDLLIRWAEALDNMAVQLRILVSVKASTNSTSSSTTSSTESSLVAITTKLADVVQSSLVSAVKWM